MEFSRPNHRLWLPSQRNRSANQTASRDPVIRMRIVVASPFLPWPLFSGGNAAQFSTLKCLCGDHQFVLVCPVYSENDLKDARELQAQLPLVEVRAVPCGFDEGATQPSRGLILRGARKCARLAGRLFARPTRQNPVPETLEYPFDPLPGRLLTALEDELSKGVDLVQVEFAQMMPLGTWLAKETPKVFIHHQIQFVYTERHLEACGRNSFTSYLEAVMRAQEEVYLQRFDGIVVF